MMTMHPRVRQLYKELIFAAQHYGIYPMHVCREKIKKPFFQNRDLVIDSPEWKKALAWGRYEVRNMLAMHEVKQYRAMRKYDSNPDEGSMFETPFSDLTRPHAPAKKHQQRTGDQEAEK